MTPIDTSAEAVEALARDHQTVGDNPAEYVMGHPHHWKTAAVLLALLKERDEARARATLGPATMTLADALKVPEVRAVVEKLRRALRPFAEYIADGGDRNYKGEPLPDTEGMGWVYLTIGDFRRARAALTRTDAAHVNETPKSEHDAGNALTPQPVTDDLVARLRANGLDECDEAIAIITAMKVDLVKGAIDYCHLMERHDELYNALAAERAKVDRLVDAVKSLEKAAAEVSRRGAETGPQWTELTVALLQARAALNVTDVTEPVPVTLAEALKVISARLDESHRQYTVSIGRDPDKYSSQFSQALTGLKIALRTIGEGDACP